MAYEIETSTDTVEQVKAALASTIEIDESPVAAEGEETPEAEAAEPAEEAVVADGSDEGQPGDEEEEVQTPKPAVKKKAVPATVPRSRLNEEIEKRRRLEGQLEEARRRPAADTEVVKPATESAPQNYCGRPKPKISDYTDHPDKYPDPYASHAEDYGEWVGDERDAKRTYNETTQRIQSEERERTQPFRDRLPAMLEERPDYNDIVLKSTAEISDAMTDFAITSEYGPDILLYFAENPAEADKITAVRNVRGQMRLMEALEEQIKSGVDTPVVTASPIQRTPSAKAATPVVPPKKVSSAPAPPTRLKPGGAAPRSLRELAGTEDRNGVDLDYNPEYTKAASARRRTPQ